MIIRFRNIHPVVKGTVANTARIIGDVEIGANTAVWSYAVLRGDYGKIRVGKYCNIQEFCMLHADKNFICYVGDKVTVAHGTVLHSCKIGTQVFIGLGARIMDNAEVGDNCLIGAGSLILPNTKIPDNSVVVGAPSRILRKIKDEDLNMIENSWKLYHENSKNFNFELL